MAAEAATQEVFRLRFLLGEMGLNVTTPIILHEDNKPCIAFTDHPGNHRNAKHIDYRHCYAVCDYCETDRSIFLKALDPVILIKFRDRLVVS